MHGIFVGLLSCKIELHIQGVFFTGTPPKSSKYKIRLEYDMFGGQSQIALYGLYQLGIQDEGDLSQTTYGAVTVVADTLQQEKTFDRMPGGVSPY